MPLQKSCNGILAPVEEKYGFPELYVSFAKNEKSTQFSSLPTGDGLRGMLEARNYFAVEIGLPFLLS